MSDSNRHPRLHGAAFAMAEPGYELHPIQLRAALTTRRHWRDLVVVSAESDGWLQLADLDGTSVRVWHHEALAELVSAGEPVALHRLYDVLSVAGGYISVRAGESAA